MSACGIPQEQICVALGIDRKTLAKHFRDPLDKAAIQANAKVASTLFQLATSGHDIAATIFWCKVRLHWTETNATRFVDEQGKDRALTLDAVRAYVQQAPPKGE